MNHLVDFKQTSTPEWASKIDRWYQLDELSYSFCEAIHNWNYLKEFPQPDQVILAIEGACNVADFDYAHTKPSSPAKFVYTLPNICSSVIFQLIGFQGKVICLNQGKHTLNFAQTEATQLANAGKTVWLFSSPSELESGKRKIIFECLTPNKSS